jgi:hypothetical protein
MPPETMAEKTDAPPAMNSLPPDSTVMPLAVPSMYPLPPELTMMPLAVPAEFTYS